MATIGWIKMGITTDTSQFKKGLDTAASSTQTFQNSLLKIAGAFAVFEAGKSAIDKVASSIRGIADTADLAGQIGLTSEAFTKLSYAAKLSGIDQDALATSLEQMQKRLGEVATTGAGPAADALKRFGLDAKNLAMSGAEKSLDATLEVLRNIQNPAERAAVAMDLFGKSGIKMISLAGAGASGLKEMGAEASKVGFALSAIDSAKVEEADDALDKMGMAVQGVWNTLAVKLSPFLTAGIEQLLDWGQTGAQAASHIAQSMGWVLDGIGLAVDGVNVLKTAFHSINMVVAEMTAYFLEGIDKILAGVDYVAKQFGQSSNLSGSMTEWAKSFRAVAVEELDAAQSAFNRIGKGAQTVRTLVDDIERKSTDRAKTAADKAAQLAMPGAIGGIAAKDTGPKFAGAAELGSKESYSTIARSRGIGGEGNTTKIAGSTERTAKGVDRLVAIMGGRPPDHGDLKPHMAGAF